MPEPAGDVHFTVWAIAKERGCFAQHLPDLEVRECAGGTGEVVRSLAAGEIDVGIECVRSGVTGRRAGMAGVIDLPRRIGSYVSHAPEGCL